jgi:hypothetical protein
MLCSNCAHHPVALFRGRGAEDREEISDEKERRRQPALSSAVTYVAVGEGMPPTWLAHSQLTAHTPGQEGCLPMLFYNIQQQQWRMADE